ncbi:MAG: transglycosylase domain-containing protein, partial [Frankiaceae bacterium]|nr:transglycosylase domain-containing protein [Frankiaceae bacterium]
MGRLSNVRWGRLLLLGGLGSVLGFLLLTGVGYAVTDVPEPNESATATATRILYSDRSEMGRVGEQNRIPVRLDAVPDDVQRAVLAAEDRNHYTDPGINPRGIARALFANVRGGGVEQGGSSITQQYAKNAFLTQDRTFRR